MTKTEKELKNAFEQLKKEKIEYEDYIERQVTHIISVMSNIALGDLTVRAKRERDDEVGALADGINMMIKEIGERDKRINERINYAAKRLNEAVKTIQEAAAGDLDVLTPVSERKDEFDALAMGINMMIEEVKTRNTELHSKIEQLDKNRLILYSLSEDIQEEKQKVEAKIVERTKELCEERAKILSLIESVKLGIIMIDLSFNIVLANSASKVIFGRFPGEPLLFKDLENLLKGIKLSQALSYYVEEGKPMNVQEIRIKEKHFRLFLSPVRDIAEKIFIGAVMILEDITEQKLVEQMRTEIVSVTSHQLRTPLSIIKGNLEMVLEDKEKLNKEQQELLQEAFLGNDRMIELVNTLMDVSKITEGKFELNLEFVSFEKLVEAVVKEFLPFAQQKGVTLSSKFIGEPFPKINTDVQRIRQVLQNLIVNAVKYGRVEGKGRVIIKVEKDKTNNFLQTSVEDKGLGIPKEEQVKIFERFFRASNANKLDPGGGTGLGLYIAKAIVEQNKGKMWFESKEKKGTTFYFTLPIKKQKVKAEKEK